MGLSLLGGVNYVKENFFFLLNLAWTKLRQQHSVAQGPHLAPGVPAQVKSGVTGRELAE